MTEKTPGETVEQARSQRLSKLEKTDSPKPRSLAQTKSQREEKQKKSPVPPLVGNQYFRVYFGSTQISFARVSNIQRTVGHEDFVEGGLNDYIHVLTKPDTASGSLTFEKGVVADTATQGIIRALAPGIRISVPVTITLYHRAEKDWKAVRSWGFEDGMVTQWELGNLDGMGNEVTIEKMTISHAGLQELKV